MSLFYCVYASDTEKHYR